MSNDDRAPLATGWPFGVRWPRTFWALRHRNFRLFFFGQLVSLSGSRMQLVALNWLVYRLTDSPLLLGLVNFVALLPVGLISLVGGVISDRFSRRNLILITQTTLALQALTLTVLTGTGLIQVWHIMILAFVEGAAGAIEQPARLAFLMDVVGKEDLSNAVGLNYSVVHGTRIVGPAIAGLLISWIGEMGCFLVNSLTYLAIIVAFLAMRLPALAKPKKPLRLAADLLDGLKYMWHDQTIRGLLSLIAASCLLSQPYIVLMPIFARDVLQIDSRGYGLLMAAIGVGALGGTLGVASMKAGRRGKWLIGGSLAFPVLLLAFALSRWLPLSVGLLALVGASQLAQRTLANSLLQLASADEFHGRVVSFFALLNNGLTRLGGVQAGVVAQFGGAPFAVWGGALLSLAWVVVLARRIPVIRHLP